MLLGEHAVMYGYPCIVTAMDQRIYIEAQSIEDDHDIIYTPQVKENRFVTESIAHFKERFNIKKNVKVETQSDFSHRVGLGSSSAVTVATLKALSVIFEIPLTTKEIFDLSYQITLSIQGVGSGFDIAAAAFGHTLYFVKGGEELEPLPTDTLPLIVAYSGTKADTPTLVRKVKETYLSDKKGVDSIFKQMQKVVLAGKKAIQTKRYPELGSIMSENHSLLQQLGVSTEKLDTLVNVSLKAGAWGAKLSGAGGGDCIVVLASQNKRKSIKEAITRSGGEIIDTKNNAEGVRLEKIT